MAHALQRAGASVFVTGRDPDKNRAAFDAFGKNAVFELDVRDEDGVAATIAQLVQQTGHIDVLINNAGNFAGGSVREMPLDDWRSVIETHLTGTFLCSKHAARAMVDRGQGGKIINIGSMYSIFGPPSYVNYAAAKSGVVGITRALAVELAADDIQVNAILPGWYKTDIVGDATETPWGERIRAKTPAARWGEPDDLAGAVVFLASAASDFVTGVALPVDGGYSIADRLLPE